MIVTLFVLVFGGMASFVLLACMSYDLSERNRALRRRVDDLEYRAAKAERARELYHIEACRYLCEIRERLQALEETPEGELRAQ